MHEGSTFKDGSSLSHVQKGTRAFMEENREGLVIATWAVWHYHPRTAREGAEPGEPGRLKLVHLDFQNICFHPICQEPF